MLLLAACHDSFAMRLLECAAGLHAWLCDHGCFHCLLSGGAAGNGFAYDIPSRAKGNQLYVPELDRIVLKDSTSKRPFASTQQCRSAGRGWLNCLRMCSAGPAHAHVLCLQHAAVSYCMS
jgi:hypothetical protein